MPWSCRHASGPDDHGVERKANILDRNILLQGDLAGVGIDVLHAQGGRLHQPWCIFGDSGLAFADQRAGAASLALANLGQGAN